MEIPSVVIDGEFPLVQYVPFPDRFFYVSDIRTYLNVLNLDLFQEVLAIELELRQDELLKVNPVDQHPFLLHHLFFNPTILSRQIRFHVQEYLSKIDSTFGLRLRIHIVLAVEIDLSKGPKASINVGIEEESETKRWLGDGTTFYGRYTPRLTMGVEGVLNAHVARTKTSYIFPTGVLQNVEFRNFDDFENCEPAYTGTFASRKEIFSHYEKFIDATLLPNLRQGYEFIFNRDLVNVFPHLSEEEINGQWTALKEKLWHYLNVQFDEYAELFAKEPTRILSGLVGILVYPPNTKSGKNDFVIMEFVLMNEQNQSIMTAEITGVVDSEISPPTESIKVLQ